MTRSSAPLSARAYDVIVIGAGHAGCEAALAAARVGARVLVLTPNLDRIGFMPCNPSIGGPAKGHIVEEVDALGGEMARAIDRTAIQIRTLNDSKGPAVRALRAQADKLLYGLAMKEALESQPGLELRQESAVTVSVHHSGCHPVVTSVATDFGNDYRCGAAVITAGTFLRGSMIAGEWRAAGGRAGDPGSRGLAMSVGEVGIRLRRLKTGTPPRVDARSINFDLTQEEPGSSVPLWFSLDGEMGDINRLDLAPLAIFPGCSNGWRTQLSCYLVHSNEAGHQLIADNAARSPMFNGAIQGIGPRYCPSIEDKVMRFRHKSSHGLFLEPEGWRTTEVYVQGANTSLPHDIQTAFLRTIPALRHVRVTRFGYAVEYDAVEPTELTPWFEAKRVGGLFLAGQVNGTSGYEEAAGQGILAGVNAARHVFGSEPLVLGRDQAYIGVMADDLTTQEFVEPYRMLTSRAEHRLVLRCDNADDRLTALAYDAGLIGRQRMKAVNQRRRKVDELIGTLAAIRLNSNASCDALLVSAELPCVTRSTTAADYARRPDVDLQRLVDALVRHGDFPIPAFDDATLSRAETELKYQAYIEKELLQIDRARRMEHVNIPDSIDVAQLAGLRNEAREKLLRVRPTTIGQASRIPGVTPGDVAVLLVHLKRANAAPFAQVLRDTVGPDPAHAP